MQIEVDSYPRNIFVFHLFLLTHFFGFVIIVALETVALETVADATIFHEV